MHADMYKDVCIDMCVDICKYVSDLKFMHIHIHMSIHYVPMSTDVPNLPCTRLCACMQCNAMQCMYACVHGCIHVCMDVWHVYMCCMCVGRVHVCACV